MKKRSVALFAFIIASITAVCLMMTGSANTTDEYILYKNDTKFTFSEYPPIMIDDEIYVPSSLFIGMKNITYEYSDKYKSFYFQNNQTRRYFAFSFNTDGIIIDNVYTEVSFPIINSTTYMPLEFCADILSLETETYTSNNIMHIRLSDASHSLDFIDLIELFNPIEPPVDDPPTPPIDVPVDPPAPPIEKQTKTVYFMLSVDDTDFLDEALGAFTAFGENATVFFTNDVMRSAPMQILRSTVNGNATGILSYEDDNVLDILRESNHTLSHILNTSTRVCLLPEASQDISSEGYIVWTPAINASDYSHLPSHEAAQKIYQDSLSEEHSSILVRAEKENQNLILALLGLFSNDNTVDLATIDPSVAN
jgi:hypothetical protein